MVRNGFPDPREVATAAGAVPVRTPRVNDKRIGEVIGQRKRFSSAILPGWARKSPGGCPYGGLSSGWGPSVDGLLVKGVPLRSMACRTSTRRRGRQIRAALCFLPCAVFAVVVGPGDGVVVQGRERG